MSARETKPCPRCGVELTYSTTVNDDGSCTVRWPKASFDHLKSHAPVSEGSPR